MMIKASILLSSCVLNELPDKHSYTRGLYIIALNPIFTISHKLVTFLL